MTETARVLSVAVKGRGLAGAMNIRVIISPYVTNFLASFVWNKRKVEEVNKKTKRTR